MKTLHVGNTYSTVGEEKVTIIHKMNGYQRYPYVGILCLPYGEEVVTYTANGLYNVEKETAFDLQIAQSENDMDLQQQSFKEIF